MAYMKAKVAYTYGWTDEEMGQLPYPTFIDYWLAITGIESEKQILGIEVACSTIMKPSDRKNVIAKYRRKSKSMIDTGGGRLATIEDVAKGLAGMLKDGGRES